MNSENTNKNLHSKIFILGAGSWGTALAIHLSQKNKVFLWGHNKKHIEKLQRDRENKKYLPNIKFNQNISCVDNLQYLDNDFLVLIVTPSYAFKNILNLLKEHNWQAKNGIAWATKGLDLKTGKFFHQVVAEVFNDKTPMAVLSGPTFAKEVANKLPTAITIAGNKQEFSKKWALALSSDNFRCYLTNDIIGVEIASATKNIIAIASGISDGLGFGANARSAIIARGLNEIMLLGEVYQVKKSTLMGLAGVGDLSLTCSDDQSRNRQLGLMLAKGIDINSARLKINQETEGAIAANIIKKIADKNNIEMPITNEVVKILNLEVSPEEATKNLLKRDNKF